MSGSTPYLKKSKTGTYYVHWTEARVGKRVSTRTTDLADAKTFLGTWLLMEHTAPQDGLLGANLTLADVWTVYERKHVQTKLAGRYNAELAWRQMEPHFGSLLASGLSQMATDDYVSKRTSGRLGRKVKPQTAAKELSYLVAAVRFCADPKRKLIDPSFVQKLDLPEPGEPRDRWLKTEEIQKLLDAARRLRRGDRLSRGERFLWLALETAARKQALLDLTWDRVDFETNVIVLDVPGRKKTKKVRATVPISKALRPILERAFEERLDKKRDDGLVLDNQGAVWATIQRIVIEAGLGGKQKKPASGAKPKATGISPHVLRHTAATHMARKGVSLWIIAKVLGNSIRMVEKVYAKHQPEDLRDAVDAISGGFLEAAE
ncbi:tyrosine-type recombinase/integrase [Nitratireductor soli]|uniref:tyrosine-type recombinase/integrase n=1 Tax=Nitratireductor soli TaxID=1670619 RepID=UPI0009E46B34|nr:site-specific integrase [Nitratireductor soli]